MTRPVLSPTIPRSSRLAWIAGALLALAIGAFGVLSVPGKIAPAPRAGFVDLSQWDFARDGAVRLGGQWLFFEGRWANAIAGARGVPARVPGPWPVSARDGRVHADGFGTYRLQIRLPAGRGSDAFAVDTGQPRTAYRLYANGMLIASGGRPAASAASELGDTYSAFGRLAPGVQTVDLRLEVSNHIGSFGGVFVPATVGLSQPLEAHRHRVEMLSLLVVGALIFAACYQLAFSGIELGAAAHVWFGILAGLVAIRNCLFEPLAREIVPYLGQAWVWRLDFAITALCLPAAYWFLALSFKRQLSARIGMALSAFAVGGAAVTLAGSVVTGQAVLKAVEIAAAAMVVYLTHGMLRALRDGEKGAGLALAGWLLVSISIVHDTLLDNQIIAGGNALPFGCVAFFLCVSGALTSRSQHAFENVERLSAELRDLNAQLESVVDARTAELRQKILELEQHQAALEQSRAAAVEANETKSRFLANMSHELRTPLNAILGFSEIIHSRLFGDSAGRYSEYAASIHKSGRHLLALIDDILDLSKIEAGKFVLFDTPLDLRAQLHAALKLVEVRAASRAIDIAIAPGEDLWIVADERALHQIVINLLTNAVKFTLPGGAVTVRSRRNDTGEIVVEVEDTGIGIKPEDMKHVLQSFGQGRHDVAASDERGTGLGLPIVKGLVEAHGGRFELESTLDVGTTARAIFPASRAFDGRERAA
jgi:signal transduction histidine kinase